MAWISRKLRHSSCFNKTVNKSNNDVKNQGTKVA